LRRLALALLLLIGSVASAAEPTVTLDVKDTDVRAILREMQKQCGIRNMLIDKEVSGAGTILFREVPCETALRVVFRQFGLKGVVDPNVVSVEPRSR
jgi:type II secretory pathway component HofQ